MERWQDQAIILSVRPHGESGAIVSVLTREYGRCAGYVRGASSSKNRGALQIGNIVDANWQARNTESLGTLSLEPLHGTAARIMHDPLKLAALQAACSLCDQSLPEKESHLDVYQGLEALFDILQSDVWAAGYVMWEIALLRVLGFSLDLSQCAGGGDNAALAYVSPKTGRAVSNDVGEPYKDKLLPLPGFLNLNGQVQRADEVDTDILAGLRLTGYFLQHWVFAHHSQGMPQARYILEERFNAHCSSNIMKEHA